MKKLLCALLCVLPISAMEQNVVKIKAASLMIPKRLGNVSVLHDEEGFRVEQNGNLYDVNNGDVDKELRHVSPQKLKAMLAKSYIAVNKSDNGDFSLKSHARVRGGGLFGAALGAFLGKGLVSVVGHGSIYLVSLGVSAVATPAVGVGVGMFLSGTIGPMIEAASMHAAIAGGMLGGVATGPV